jgi:cell division protein DivIC
MLSKIPSWLKNRYLLTTVAFVLWILFFDRNDIFTQMERARDLKSLEKSKLYYNGQIQEAQNELDQMQPPWNVLPVRNTA